MKNIVFVAASAAALLVLGGCATTAPEGTTASAKGELSVYYDGTYGPLTSGYWGVDEHFYYRDATGAYVRDYAGHIQRSPGSGYVLTRVMRGG